ncbi:MAG: NAD(P)-dependent oxidoreductase [Acetobacteraceae bacterium]
MKVAVTGASGMLGRFVVAALAGHTVVALDRVACPEHCTVLVDMLDRDGLAAALAGCDAVIHLAAIDGARVATEDAFYEVNVLGTWNVLSAAERLGLRRAVVCSSVAALGLRPGAPPQTLPVGVDHRMRPVSAYGLSKQGVETLAAGFAARGRMRVACLRPALVTFPHQVAEWAAVAAEADGLPRPPGVAGGAAPGPGADPADARLCRAGGRCARLCRGAGGGYRRPVLLLRHRRGHAQPAPDGRGHCGAISGAAAGRAAGLFAELPQASPFDLEAARTVLGWSPRDRWRDIVARHGVTAISDLPERI